MKLHWGHGIFIFYTFFAASLVVVVIKSRGFDNSLVTEAYYQRDINYQQEFDRRQNSKSLAQSVSVMKVGEQHQLLFPKNESDGVAGTVLLYRPSSKKDDRMLPLKVNASGIMGLNTKGLKPGRYQAIVEWSANGTDYYDELDLTL